MADETPAPLSDAEIRWLRIGLEDIKRHGVSLGSPTLEMTRRLYATILAQDARLAALERENAAMRAIVAAVADFDSDDAYDGAYKCHWCSYSYMMPPDDATHDPDCPIVTARALLAMQTPATQQPANGEDD